MRKECSQSVCTRAPSPIFASAYVAGSRAALLVGLAAALGAAISMGMSEALSDDGELTGRGGSIQRGVITTAELGRKMEEVDKRKR